MNTNTKGKIAEAKVLARLLEEGKRVLVPFDVCAYDLALDDEGTLVRIQCKNGRFRNGKVVFNAYSSARAMSVASKCKTVNYREKADFFGVWCGDLGKVYLIPVKDVGLTKVELRVENPIRSNSRIRWAVEYEV